MVDKTEDFSWPNATATTTWQQLKEDFQRDPYAGSVFQIGFGVIDVIAGAVMTLGTCGGAVVPGLGLIVVGVDQIAAGINNAQNPGSPSMSVLEYGGYSLAKGLGASENTAQAIGAYTPAALSAIFNVWGSLAACFRRGTPFRTPDGSKPVEQLRKGDKVLSRAELDPLGHVEAKEVEEVFVRLGRVMLLRVSGREIGTTSEHPFWVKDRGWIAAGELKAGDLLASEENGRWLTVDGVKDTGRYESVYNIRVADYHTYFVGELDWDFAVWAHNVYNTNKIGSIAESLAKQKLESKGWTVLGALQRGRNGIDLIAQRLLANGTVKTIIAEVKANSARLSALQKLGPMGYAQNVIARLGPSLPPNILAAVQAQMRSGSLPGIVMRFDWTRGLGVLLEIITKW